MFFNQAVVNVGLEEVENFWSGRVEKLGQFAEGGSRVGLEVFENIHLQPRRLNAFMSDVLGP